MTTLEALGMERVSCDVSDALADIVRAAFDIMSADAATIHVADEPDVLLLSTDLGVDQVFRDHFGRVETRAQGALAQAVASRRQCSIGDVSNSSLIGDLDLTALEHAGVRALQASPLFNGDGTLIGVCCVYYRSPRVFDDMEIRWLDRVSARAAMLIERATHAERFRDANRVLERRVAEQTRALHDALSGAHAGTWHINLRSNAVQWDERSREMFGAQQLAYRFDPTFPEVHRDDRARLQDRFARMQIPGDDLWDMTFRVTLPTGSIAWIRGVGRIERDADGHPIAFNGINLDVTEQRHLEQALIDSQAHEHETADTLESLLNASAEGIFSLDRHGVIRKANEALHAMFGYEPGELVGRGVEQLVPDAARAAHTQNRERFWTSRQSRKMGESRDLSGRRKDGSTFPVEVSLTRLPSPPPDGRVFAFVTDITTRKQAEHQLRESHQALRTYADQLHRRNEQLRRMASDLTLSEQHSREQLAKTIHDHLQQLLFSAKLRADRLAAAPADAGTDGRGLIGKVRDDLEAAIAAARSLSVELSPPTLHQDGLAAGLVWLGGWMKEQYGLKVDVIADPDAVLAGPAHKDLRTLAFESVRELLFDVVKHAQVTSATVTLTRLNDDQLQIIVADQGVGFDPAGVFQSASRSSGWGLFSIHERTALLGGSFNVQSAPGHGTRFTLVLPRTGSRRPRTSRTLRILIADDHAVARAGIREMLGERPEFEIVGEASTGTEAVALAHTLAPDAIIMDVAMPHVDGVEATRRIHAELPAIQIFGLSTQERPDGLHAIEKAGAAGYFSKGDNAQQLMDRLLSLHDSGPAVA